MGALCSRYGMCKSICVVNSIREDREKSTIKLLMIGLDNAGKTTTVRNLMGESLSDVVPTLGFSTIDMKKYRNFKVEIYDLGGSKKIRDIWKNYFALVHGLVYVIDSSDSLRIDEVKDSLKTVLGNDKVQRKPLLILINKQDLNEAMDDVELCSQLDIESIVNENQCPTKIESCSALYSGFKAKRDESIIYAYTWLLKYIESHWTQLKERVDLETAKQIEFERRVLQERMRRFRRQSETIEVYPHSGTKRRSLNPFKPINKIVPAIDTSYANGSNKHLNGNNCCNGDCINNVKRTELTNNVTVVEIHPPVVHNMNEDTIEISANTRRKSTGLLEVNGNTLTEVNGVTQKRVKEVKRSNTAVNKIKPLIEFRHLRRSSR